MYRFLSKPIVQITICLFITISVTPHHRCVIMHEVVDEPLRKICHYQQNVPQLYYLLDTLEFNILTTGVGAVV